MNIKDNRVIQVGGDKDHPANFGRLCTKGSTCSTVLDAPGRLSYGHFRDSHTADFQQKPISEIMSFAASRLRAIIDNHGPDSVAFYVSGQISMESQYLANKLCKGFIGTNNIDSNSRLCMSSAASGYKLSLGADAPPGSYQDFDHSDCFFVIGSNMADCHPVLFLRMLDRCNNSGAKLIVVDPRRTATAEKANLYLPIKPGTDLALLNGILHLLVKENRIDPAFIQQHVEGWDELQALLPDYTPRKCAEITGLPEESIRKAASWIGDAKEFMTCWTMGLNQSTHGTWSTNAICNLHLATGKICRKGSGPFSLTGQPNAMGGRETGYLSHGLPGQRAVTVAEDRAFMEQIWGLKPGAIKAQPGCDAVTLFKKLETGQVKAVWIIGTNPVASMPNRRQAIAGLQKAELVIVQDAFTPNETTPFAHVLLPGALWAEAEGVMVNSERNITLMPKAVDPRGETLADWDLIARIASMMGYGDAFSFKSASEVFNEIRRTWNAKTGYDLRGIDYEKLRRSPMQWPCPPGEKRGQSIRYLRNSENGGSAAPVFPFESGKARFFARPHLSPAEMPDGDFPFVLTTGRLPHQWHTMTKTGRVPTLNKLNPSPFIEINTEDAANLGVATGQVVEVRSRRGFARYPARVTQNIRVGTCFAPIHWNDTFGANLAINDTTSDATDPISLQPELKFCAVLLQKAIPEELPLGKTVTGGRQSQALREALGLPDSKPPSFDAAEREYISGFIVGLSSAREDAGAGIPVIPASSSFSSEKRAWLNGLLAGMFSRDSRPRENIAASKVENPLLIMVGSQTGRAEGVSSILAAEAVKNGYAPNVLNMMEFGKADLQKAARLLVVTSTYGDGDPPDNAREFWTYLNSDVAPSLANQEYAVLALGDKSFAHFCNFGRNIDARLEKLGAKRILNRCECDADYEQTANQWIAELFKVIGKDSVPRGESSLAVQEPKSLIAVAPKPVPVPAPPVATIPRGPRTVYSRKNPYPARLTANRMLSSFSAPRETRHFEISLGDSGIVYRPGDLLGIWPENCRELVREFLDVLNCSGQEPVPGPDRTEIPLRHALALFYDITRITREFIQAVSHRTANPALAALLLPSNKEELKTYTHGRQIADVLLDYPNARFSASEFCGLLKKLQPRMYTIASSLKAHPGQVHLTSAVVRYGYCNRRRKGVCSTFLADRADEKTAVPIFVQASNNFNLPADGNKPVIMVGPGTGIAGFRAFLEERRETGCKGRNWLLFGEESSRTSFFYRGEIEQFVKDGLLTRLDVAFLRDQTEAMRVEQRMRQNARELWAWLEEGAHFYVSGDANIMAPSVDAALQEIVAEQGAMSAEQALEYLENLKTQKRYQRDVY